MYLRAISVGYAVPSSSFAAVVHSVFRSAVNLKLEREGGLLTLLPFRGDDIPQGIRLDSPRGLSFDEIPVGSRGICRDGVLELEKPFLTIDLRNAKCWDRNLPTIYADMTNPSVGNAWQTAWKAVNDRQVNSGSELIARDLLCQASIGQSTLKLQISRSLRNLFMMTTQCNFADVDVIGALIGLGNGLTPSGDDLLVGYLAGLWCAASKSRERLNFLSALCAAVIRLAHGTNDISKTYLLHATEGHFSSRLISLCSVICQGLDARQVWICAEAAMRTGHTSGMDTVTGLLFGFAAWGGVGLDKGCE